MKDRLKKELLKRAAKSATPMLKKAARKDLRVAAALRAAQWAADRVSGRSKRSRRMELAARGLAAAAVALPLGLIVGYRMRSDD